jgi:hypothetical protein
MSNEFDFPIIEQYRKALSLENRQILYQWKFSCLNAIEIIAGKKSIFYERFRHRSSSYTEDDFHKAISFHLSALKALKEDLEMGFLYGVEMLVTKDILDTIFDEARTLLKARYKDAAAIYCRVIIETALKKICDKNKITYRIKERLSTISNKLRKKGHLNLPEWRQIQAWADIGNAAAHGKFDAYTADDVKNMLDGLETFLKTKIT